MSIPSSPTPASQMTPSLALHSESTPEPVSFENPFSEISDSSLATPKKEGSANPLQGDSSSTPVDINTSIYTRTEVFAVNISAGMETSGGQLDSVLLPSISGPSLVQNNDIEGATERGLMETSYDYLFEEDLSIEKGILSNILAHVLSSTPRWDETPRVLNLQQSVENEDDLSDDDQPLIWKVKKLAVRSHQKESGDQVRPPVTRSSSRRLMEDVLKDNQQKTTQRRKLKRKMIVEEDVPVSRRRPGDTVAEDVPAKSVTSNKSKQNPLSTSRNSEGPSTSSISKVLTREERQELMKQQKEVERLTALLSQRDAEIANLKAAQTEGPGPMQDLRQENDDLKDKVHELTQKLLYAHEAADERMPLLLQKLYGLSCP
ncbi:hypothetical protein HAX54_015064 [Datura stramonium]|uniref:Uncharacterized protein n=1 Tax=Datura stramonium TaxID=4076 RepID=A0ABS8TP25_DATST|nr:hypothetical protein [Datura stramonium]